MGKVIKGRFRRRHARASQVMAHGRDTFEGQSTDAGQWSENHCIVFSKRLTWMSAPRSSAPSFFVSPKARQLTVERSMPSIAAYARAVMRSSSMPFMQSISVKLPLMSTVILPEATIGNSSYITGMGNDEIMQWIEPRLKARKISANRASKEAGVPDAIRNIKRGLSKPKIETLWALAKVLGEPPPGLFERVADPLSSPLPTLDDLRAERERLDITISVLEARQKRTG